MNSSAMDDKSVLDCSNTKMIDSVEKNERKREKDRTRKADYQRKLKEDEAKYESTLQKRRLAELKRKEALTEEAKKQIRTKRSLARKEQRQKKKLQTLSKPVQTLEQTSLIINLGTDGTDLFGTLVPQESTLHSYMYTEANTLSVVDGADEHIPPPTKKCPDVTSHSGPTSADCFSSPIASSVTEDYARSENKDPINQLINLLESEDSTTVSAKFTETPPSKLNSCPNVYSMYSIASSADKSTLSGEGFAFANNFATMFDYSVAGSPAKKATPNTESHSTDLQDNNITDDVRLSMDNIFAFGIENDTKRKCAEVLESLKSVKGDDEEQWKKTRQRKQSFVTSATLEDGNLMRGDLSGDDDYCLLSKGEMISGHILNYYRILLLNRERDRALIEMNISEKTCTNEYRSSWIYDTYFMLTLLGKSHGRRTYSYDKVALIGGQCDGTNGIWKLIF